MAVAALPASTFAASCTATGFIRDGIDLTAARIGGAVTGSVDATGCDIARLQPDERHATPTSTALATTASSSTASNVNTTNSKVHQIGESPFDGMQHGRAILYINGASGTISGNKVYDFQKNGIEVRGVTADASAPSSTKTSATIANNVITGRGPIDYIAQNGIVILGNATATVKDNTVSHLWYTPDGHRRDRPAERRRRQDHGVGQQVRRHRGAHRRRGDRERPGRLDDHGRRPQRPRRPPQLREAGRPGHARHQARLEDQGRRQRQAAHQAGLQRARRRTTSTSEWAGTWSRGTQERRARPQGRRPLLHPHSNTQRSPGPIRAGAFSCLSRRPSNSTGARSVRPAGARGHLAALEVGVLLPVLSRTVATALSSPVLAAPWAVRCGAVVKGGFGRPDGHPRS